MTPPACLPTSMDCQPSPMQSPLCDSPIACSRCSQSQGVSNSRPLASVGKHAYQMSLSSHSCPGSPNPMTPNDNLIPTSPEDDYLINPEEISLGQLLGQGGFGAVHLATYRGQTVAVKTFSSDAGHEVVSDTYHRELNALTCQFQHSNVVTVLGATSTLSWQQGACIVMQYAGGENLQSYILDTRNPLPLDLILNFTRQIIAGLDHLHSKKLIHLDIKPANCILDIDNGNNPALRITDYGLSNMEMVPWSSHNLGTVPFRAPELFCGGLPSYSSDVYSLAVLMWCLDRRQLPFPNLPLEAIIWGTVQNKMRPEIPDCCDHPLLPQFRQLYTDCWSSEPADRPKLERVLTILKEMSCSASPIP